MNSVGPNRAINGQIHLKRPRRRRRWLVALAVLAALTMGAAGACWLWFLQLLDGPVTKGDFEKTVTVVRGASYRSIVEQLRTAGLLPHPFVFEYLNRQRGKTAHLKPGRYVLRSTMSVRQIYEAMTRGAPIRVTVPETWTIRQIAARLLDEGLATAGDSFTSAASSPLFLARHDIKAASAEGYILPETYLFDPGVSVNEILESMVAAFERHHATDAAKPRPQSLTWHQVLTLASMIERETSDESEKPLVGSVYYNRLKRGMTLDCDATLRYALSKWHEPLTKSDLKLDSPYNTYLHPGLPPGPISCVSQSSLDAALAPATSDFLFYCQKDEHSHEFSKTLAEHNRAVQKYLRKDLTRKAPEG